MFNRVGGLAGTIVERQCPGMAANTSQAQARSLVLRATVAEYRAWTLIATCRPCGAPRSIPLAALPPALTLGAVLMRMRCRTCRGRVEAAALDNGLPGRRGRALRIWGPGSYG